MSEKRNITCLSCGYNNVWYDDTPKPKLCRDCAMALTLPLVGDINSTARGTGARYTEGKPDYSLMPLHLFEEVCHVWKHGEEKYRRWNWARGMAWSVPYACICRHLFAWYRGERNDPESGCSHLAHIVCNVIMLMHFDTFYPEGDDRPVEYFKDGSE